MRASIVAAALVAFLIGAGSTPARADADVESLLKSYDAATPELKEQLEVVIMQTQYGILWMNTYVANARNEAPVYCQPSHLALTGSQVVDMLRRDAQRTAGVAKLPYGVAIIRVLRQTFPCK
jgi:hypothetical protein